VQSLIEEHLTERAAQGKSPATLDLCRYWLQCFARYCQTNALTPAQLQEKDLTAFHQHLLWTPGNTGLRSHNTVQQALQMVRHFLRWCHTRGYLAGDVTQNCRLHKARPRPAVLLTRPQLDAILQAPDGKRPAGLRDLAVLTLICELGFYGTACAQLDLADLDLSSRRLRGRPLSPHSQEVLQRYLLQGRPALLVDPDDPALFLNAWGRRFEPYMVRHIVKRYHPVDPRTLHKSWTAHKEAFLARRLG
jgi:site-specific recombinase XerD